MGKGIKTEVSMNLKCRFEAIVFREGFISLLFWSRHSSSGMVSPISGEGILHKYQGVKLATAWQLKI